MRNKFVKSVMARYRLLELRKEHGKTQKQLAHDLGITQGFLSSVENGRNPFPDERVEDLRKVFPGVDLTEYEVPEEDYPHYLETVGSNNRFSEVRINDPETLRQMLEMLERVNRDTEKEKNCDDEEIKRLREENARLSRQLDEQRSKYDDCRDREIELRDELWRLRELLTSHGIPYTQEKK